MKLRKKEQSENEKAEKRRLRRDRLKRLTRRAKKDESPTPQLSRHRHRRWSGIGFLFMCFGGISFALSIIYDSSILAFIGLGLTLWGGLFFFIKPTKYVKLNVFDAAMVSPLLAIDKILAERNCQGPGVHFPPRDHEKLKDVVVVVPLKNQRYMPKAKVLAQGKVFLNSKGMCLIPPGQGLMNLYEKELRTDFSKRDLNYLRNKLSKLLVENLEILEDLEINKKDDVVYVKMKGAFHKNLCNQFRGNTHISRLGCPICSSIACALAKATDQAVTIERNWVSVNWNTTETWYRLIKWDSS
jgi:hypothetical protein